MHQLYFKAQYDPLPGWSFDEARLGVRHGRRLEDKLNWVFAITGRHLSASQEMPGLLEIKALRNHLQHFDPPCFAFSVEDVARWLNRVSDVARLAWRIRSAIGSPLSEPLIRLLLTPDVVFIPRDPNRPRRPQTRTGYASTRWPSQ